jgi:hypothetical protein
VRLATAANRRQVAMTTDVILVRSRTNATRRIRARQIARAGIECRLQRRYTDRSAHPRRCDGEMVKFTADAASAVYDDVLSAAGCLKSSQCTATKADIDFDRFGERA